MQDDVLPELETPAPVAAREVGVTEIVDRYLIDYLSKPVTSVTSLLPLFLIAAVLYKVYRRSSD